MHVIWGISLSLKALWLNNNRLLLLGPQAMFLSIRSGIHFSQVFHEIHVRLIRRANVVVIALRTETTPFLLFVGEGTWCFFLFTHICWWSHNFCNRHSKKEHLVLNTKREGKATTESLSLLNIFTSLGSPCTWNLWNLSYS